tara:strand:- start:207 stop:794 length:588 start_codon:yes stop_codon:yes gene_type:complete
MAVTINGNGTVTGVSVGGLPDGIVDAGTLASNSVETAKIATEAVTGVKQGPGSVVQWVQAANADIQGRHSESAGNWENTGNHIDITPTNATNLIIVGGHLSSHVDSSTRWVEFAIYNGTTRDTLMTNGYQEGGSSTWYSIPFKYSQIAGTTDPMTFHIYMKNGVGSNNAYVGWNSTASAGSTKNWNDLWAAEVVV